MQSPAPTKSDVRVVKPDTSNAITEEKFQPKPDNPILKLVGKQVGIQERTGATITGTIKSYRHGLIKLENATVSHPSRTTPPDTLPWVLLDRTSVLYVYPA